MDWVKAFKNHPIIWKRIQSLDLLGWACGEKKMGHFREIADILNDRAGSRPGR